MRPRSAGMTLAEMAPTTRFNNRAEAGRALADAVYDQLARPQDNTAPDAAPVVRPVVVLGLARGGVPVAVEVAARLTAPVDVLVVRKLGAPTQPEFAFGAIAEGGVTFIDAATVAALNLLPDDVAQVKFNESLELKDRVRKYRADRPLLDVREKHVVLVDDGLATGATMQAAIRLAEDNDAAAITVAIPVAAPEAIALLQAKADVVWLRAPSDFGAVGYFYKDFNSPTDDEIRALLG
ncbi:MAG: phosphoribosyltransferase [Acidothermaceae bacterium]